MQSKIFNDNGILFINLDEIGKLRDYSDEEFSIWNFGCNNVVEAISSNENSYNLIKNFNLEDFINDIAISLVGNERIIHIGKKNNILHVTITFSITPDTWEEYYPYGRFKEEFIKFTKNESSFYIEYDDQMYHISIYKKYYNNEKIFEIFDDLNNLYITKYKEFFFQNQIVKFIQFSPEHFTAGISILQYFGKLLQEKYPNEEVSVSIKQEGLKVTMSIETPDGKKEEIEKYLNKFGMVVTNQMTVKEFALNPIQQLELETKLNAAEQEICFQKKLLALQDKTYDENLLSLKDEVKFLREELSSLRIGNNENIQLLLSSLKLKDKMIKNLTKSIENKNVEETKTLLLELKTKDKNSYKNLKEHIDSFVVGSFTNTPSWIEFIRGIIPS